MKVQLLLSYKHYSLYPIHYPDTNNHFGDINAHMKPGHKNTKACKI